MSHLAIDLGSTKSKSVAILFDDQDTEGRTLRFATTEEGIVQVIERHSVTLVIIEMCTPAYWVTRLLQSLGVEVIVANTNDQTFRDAKRRDKSDLSDAKRLRDLYLLGKILPVHILSEYSHRLRSVIDQRWQVRGMITATKNRIRSLLSGEGIRLKGAWTAKTYTQLETLSQSVDSPWDPRHAWQIQVRIATDLLLGLLETLGQLDGLIHRATAEDAQAQVLRTVPGIGPLISATLSASYDDPRRFRNGKQVSKYSGLSPHLHQSGKTFRPGSISRHSWSTLRAYLVEATHNGVHRTTDPWFANQYARLLPKGRKKLQVIVAIARKLYVRCWRMLLKGCTWQELNRLEGLADSEESQAA